MHLLQLGVAVSEIALWLGHENMTTILDQLNCDDFNANIVIVIGPVELVEKGELLTEPL